MSQKAWFLAHSRRLWRRAGLKNPALEAILTEVKTASNGKENAENSDFFRILRIFFPKGKTFQHLFV